MVYIMDNVCGALLKMHTLTHMVNEQRKLTVMTKDVFVIVY